MQTYAEAIGWLYSTQKSGIKLGLENIRLLLARLGNPQETMRFLHIAGTNGKGSICALLDAALRQNGIRTGLFTSPHLIQFGERIRVNGAMAPECGIIDGLQRIRRIMDAEDFAPTFFEITTALAMLHFAEEGVEIGVLETGLGGRLDATNAMTPVASIISSIDLDHQDWLGHTLAEIAREKAGIFKRAVPAVSVPQHPEVAAVLTSEAARMGAPLRFVEPPGEPFALKLAGAHQQINAAAAFAALEHSGLILGKEAILAGFLNTEWPARFHEVRPGVILDGAHNPAAAARLAETWRERFGDRRATIVFGALKDKDYPAMARALAPIGAEWILTPVASERGAPMQEFLKKLRSELHAPVQSAESVKDAIDQARRKPNPVLVTGSLFLTGEALSVLGWTESTIERSVQ